MTFLPNSMNQVLDSIKDINFSSRQQQSIGVITAAAMITSYSIYKLWFQGSSDGCPTVPYRNPLTGSSAEFRRDPHAFVEKWTAKLGPVYRAHLFGRMHTIVSGRYVREVFLNDKFSFMVGNNKKFDVQLIAGIPGGSIPEEDARKFVVKYLTPNLKAFTARAVENLNSGLREVLGEVKEPKDVPHVFPLVQRMVARASASVFVGEDLCKNDKLVDAFQNITTDLGSMLRVQSWLEPFVPLMRLKMWSIGKFSPTVASYRKTMLTAMAPEIDRRMTAAKEDPDWKRPMDVLQDLIENVVVPRGQNIYDHIVNYTMGLIFASIHTTSENGTIVLYRILQNPELMKDLLEEQKEVLEHYGVNPNGNAKDVFTFDIIKGMPKLDSIIRESLRLRNEFYELTHTNVTSQNIVLSNGTVIPPNGDVLINNWYNHQCDGWAEYKDDIGSRAEFHPYRTLNTGRPSTKISDDYLVFGEGKHACPGRWFAVQEIKTIVSILLRDYVLTPSSDVVFPTTTATAMPFGSLTIEKRQRT